LFQEVEQANKDWINAPTDVFFNKDHNYMRRSPKNTGKQNHKRNPGKNRKEALRNQDWLYGRHAVLAALANPDRHIVKLHGTSNALKVFEAPARARNITPVTSTTSEISTLLPAGAVHQGIAAKAMPLVDTSLNELPLDRPVIVLDQVTDPHNVGAILRSAAVFNAAALIMTRRNSPPLTGVLAKSACGAIEHVPVVFVGNLSQTLIELGKIGFWRIGLAGEATSALETSTPMTGKCGPVALVLGAEDKGLRRLTIEQCDEVCHITTLGKISSLNVSNAAAIALHVISRNKQ
jgi:23S rRNA (guanosine2251-2'-O)-methyltransferase